MFYEEYLTLYNFFFNKVLLIYVHKITPRVKYIFEYIFSNCLKISFQITRDIDDFQKSDLINKLVYSTKNIGSYRFIKSNKLLFENDIKFIDFTVKKTEKYPLFFDSKTDDENAIFSFDIFSASFYLLSRYEEYLPHIKDKHLRYDAKNSIAYKNSFLELPVVDLWLKDFNQVMEERFVLEKRKEVFKENGETLSLITIPETFSYLKKGLIRNFVGFCIDLYALSFSKALNRILVLLKAKKDPYDIYESLINFHKKHKIECKYFVLVADHGAYDKNIPHRARRFRNLTKSLADYSSVNILASYESLADSKSLIKEKKRLENILKRPLDSSRFLFNRLIIPEAYRMLIDEEIKTDFTMGYHNYVGFRASTSKPFLFYDLVYEYTQPLLIRPVSINAIALKKYKTFKIRKRIVEKIKSDTFNVKGDFIFALSNNILSDKEWFNFYKNSFKKWS